MSAGKKLAEWIKSAEILNRTALCKKAKIDRANFDKYLAKGEIPLQHIKPIIEILARFSYPLPIIKTLPPSADLKIEDTSDFKIQDLTQQAPSSNFVINTVSDMPIRKAGESSIDFGVRKSLWKSQQGS